MKNNIVTVENSYYTRDFSLFDNSPLSEKLNNHSEIDLDLLKENLINNLHILELMNTKFKNMILYQLIFCFELFLKYELAKYSFCVSLNGLKKYKHNIDYMIEELSIKTGKKCYREIAREIKKIKLDNDKKIDLSQYIDFKYNFDETNYIFVNNKIITKKEERIIKEVIKCITSLIIIV